MSLHFREMFRHRFGDERRAKRGLFWQPVLSRDKVRLCASLGAIGLARWDLEGFCRTRR